MDKWTNGCSECGHPDFKHDTSRCIELACQCLSFDGTTPRWWRS